MKDIYNPVSTYRFQFNNSFGFRDAVKVVPYLKKMGVRTVYASPVFRAVPGSDHGYDVIVPDQLNDEIGTEKEFQELIEVLSEAGIGWIQDVVPNHMAFTPDNPWIFDVLQKGVDSKYFKYFDLETKLPAAPKSTQHFRLMLPFLGGSLDEVIRQKELNLVFTQKGFMIRYYASEYPVSQVSYQWIFSEVLNAPGSLTESINKLLEDTDNAIEERIRQFRSLYNSNSEFTAFTDHCIEKVNENPQLIESLVSIQHYEPVHWQETEKRINFRRFFTINGLICINIQDQEVFDTHHRLIRRWINEGTIQGLRVDHIDGLYAPENYLLQLRDLGGDHFYLVVEKILEKGEKIPENWPVQGTTGYDFLGMVNNLLTNKPAEKIFHEFLNEWSEQDVKYRKVALEKKWFFLNHRFSGDLENLFQKFRTMDVQSFAEIGSADLKAAIAGFLVHCPVYRIYRVPSDFQSEDRQLVEQIFEDALSAASSEKQALKLLKELFLSAGQQNSELLQQIDHFFRRCMQFTGPLMAKGIEDTLFYSYTPFLAHNEVGDSPGFFGIRKEKFHQEMIYRRKHWPLAMNATSTHDTKRGADARARLNVLSDIPEKWMEITRRWKDMNNTLKNSSLQEEIPTRNDAYFIYQSLVAHFPMNGAVDETFKERFSTFLIKALREAKLNTSWSEPNEQYEEHSLAFIENILDASNPFSNSLNQFVGEIKKFGAVNSLVQLILRNTVPGVPDNFQGSEDWNLNFVDPDNRKPVDYRQLSDDLDQMIEQGRQDQEGLVRRLWKNFEDGKIKQWVNYLTFKVRIENPLLFSEGDYIPLMEQGDLKNHIIAYQRKYKDDYLLVVLPLNIAALSRTAGWQDTRVILPDHGPLEWTNIFTGITKKFESSVPVDELFSEVPIAVLRAR